MRRRHVEKAGRIRDTEKHYKCCCCWRSGGGDWSINRIKTARAARWIKQSARQKRLLYILCLETDEVKRYIRILSDDRGAARLSVQFCRLTRLGTFAVCAILEVERNGERRRGAVVVEA